MPCSGSASKRAIAIDGTGLRNCGYRRPKSADVISGNWLSVCWLNPGGEKGKAFEKPFYLGSAHSTAPSLQPTRHLGVARSECCPHLAEIGELSLIVEEQGPPGRRMNVHPSSLTLDANRNGDRCAATDSMPPTAWRQSHRPG